MHVLAKRCKEMYGGPRKTKLTVVSGTVGHTSEATLCERFGGFGNLHRRLTLECFDNEVIHVRFTASPSCTTLLLVELVARNSWALLCFLHRLLPLRASGPLRGRTSRPRRRLA